MFAPVHLLAAAMAGATAFPGQLVQVGISTLAGVFPDIDQPSSLIGKGAFFISWPIRIIFGHRTITHSLLGFLATTLLLMAGLSIAHVKYAAGLVWPWAIGYRTVAESPRFQSWDEGFFCSCNLLKHLSCAGTMDLWSATQRKKGVKN
ncbi:MAG: metal-dependent hydrolase [Bacillota bacterium]